MKCGNDDDYIGCECTDGVRGRSDKKNGSPKKGSGAGGDGERGSPPPACRGSDSEGEQRQRRKGERGNRCDELKPPLKAKGTCVRPRIEEAKKTSMASKNPQPKSKKKPQRGGGGGGPTPPSSSAPVTCSGCSVEYPSKNALFRHLRVTDGRCLPPSERDDFVRYVVNADRNLEKILVLYGYVVGSSYLRGEMGHGRVGRDGVAEEEDDAHDDGADGNGRRRRRRRRWGVRGGDHASSLVTEAIRAVAMGGTDDRDGDNGNNGNGDGKAPSKKANRSYGSKARGGTIVSQDAHTSAITEVLTARAPPLAFDDDEDDEGRGEGERQEGLGAADARKKRKEKAAARTWTEKVNAELEARVSSLRPPSAASDSSPGKVRVFGRMSCPQKKFDAEIDATFRRVEYILPADLLLPPEVPWDASDEVRRSHLDRLPSFRAGNNPHLGGTTAPGARSGEEKGGTGRGEGRRSERSERDDDRPREDDDGGGNDRGTDREKQETEVATTTTTAASTLPAAVRPRGDALDRMRSLKRLMQRFTTRPAELDVRDASAVKEKEWNDAKRRRLRRHQSERNNRRKGRDRGGGDGAERKKTKKGTSDGINSGKNGGDVVDDDGTRERKENAEAGGGNEGDASDAVDGTGDAAGRGEDDTATASNGAKKVKTATTTTVTAKKPRILRRKRFHNFTPRALAHDFQTYRRMDRFYHRATMRFDDDNDKEEDDDEYDVVVGADGEGGKEGAASSSEGQQPAERCRRRRPRPFVVLSLGGDAFLTGQARAVAGLFVAVARGVVDPEIALDCVFDETYPHLVPCPYAPRCGVAASEASYTNWEGKLDAVLSARRSGRYPGGWGDDDVVSAVEAFREEVYRTLAQAWMAEGEDEAPDGTGRLVAERRWVEEYLTPWAESTREKLEEYRSWKMMEGGGSGDDKKVLSLSSSAGERTTSTNGSSAVVVSHAPPPLLPPLESVDATVPDVYHKVLRCLREADASGLWPTTTPKRQLVMVSTRQDDEDSAAGPRSLAVASHRAKGNKVERASAYSFAEGQGGASGSFSVGAMPGDQCVQPKGNALFPELVRAAFELEVALCPEREPSSTIAVNRNAQFRPHTDSGAGAGQSTSLIVGLGTYAGGELMVEGDKRDIRYRPVEFNGWTQRHWTLPFVGERFSLVWFTPKGCEGVRGIDICT